MGFLFSYKLAAFTSFFTLLTSILCLQSLTFVASRFILPLFKEVLTITRLAYFNNSLYFFRNEERLIMIGLSQDHGDRDFYVCF